MASESVKGAEEVFSFIESVCGKDERFQVDPMTSQPYKWICFLQIESVNGNSYLGSGFLINLPNGYCAGIVTSGHCTFVDGAYARKITVKFPGKRPIEVTEKDDLYAAPEYRDIRNKDYDYGLIVLRGTPNYGFGWTTRLTDRELTNRIVTNCGYPGDKPRGTMWITGGEIERCTSKMIYYMNDTAAGQSGSPVYTWDGGYWRVVGVHSYGGCPNHAPRFTRQMISRFLTFVKAMDSSNQVNSEALPLEEQKEEDALIAEMDLSSVDFGRPSRKDRPLQAKMEKKKYRS